MKQISSRENPQFRQLLNLSKSAKERSDSGLMLLDGDHLVQSCAQAGIPISVLAIGQSAYEGGVRRELYEKTSAESRFVLDDRLLRLISPVATASGLVAVAGVPVPEPFPQIVETCMLLEAIQDPGNLGTMLRTAAAAGLRHIFLSQGSTSAWSPRALRGGMGAQFQLSVHEDADLPSVARAYKGDVLATVVGEGESLYECNLRGPIAWLFGNEGSGLSAELKGSTTRFVRIPMPGAAESLNVASAAAVCVFEQVRQLQIQVSKSAARASYPA